MRPVPSTTPSKRTSSLAGGYVSPLAQQAFQDAMDRFASDLAMDTQKAKLVEKATSIQDIQAIVHESFAEYSDERKFPRARKWLQRIISKIHHYSNVMDVMVQHHPEY